MSTNIREFAVMGARISLIELEKRKQAILKQFPELDIEETAEETNATEPPVGASGRRLTKNGMAYRIWAWWTTNKKISSISTRDVVEALNVKTPAAASGLNQLVAQKLAKRVGRGVFRLV